jgi:hypothetical protein
MPLEHDGGDLTRIGRVFVPCCRNFSSSPIHSTFPRDGGTIAAIPGRVQEIQYCHSRNSPLTLSLPFFGQVNLANTTDQAERERKISPEPPQPVIIAATAGTPGRSAGDAPGTVFPPRAANLRNRLCQTPSCVTCPTRKPHNRAKAIRSC